MAYLKLDPDLFLGKLFHNNNLNFMAFRQLRVHQHGIGEWCFYLRHHSARPQLPLQLTLTAG